MKVFHANGIFIKCITYRIRDSGGPKQRWEMAGVEEETEEVLVANSTQDTLHLDSLIGHIESIILSKFSVYKCFL